ncbi:hypothetical protein [Glaciecola petra]|uniref:PEP-CTERM protein-sorting domain-containing protein n=1 Tax=Glaciecola petra TaxID=3075602 RepID=A0ABU2ZR47_9ALTE|nr:hypothetical protein [Aestuariibacter sp. P117]MDT0595111.1 hypothetical protein [Aestuariibacter sp. P117]
MKSLYVKTLITGILLTACSIVNATLILDAGASSTSQNFSGGNYSAGTEFTLSTGLSIDGLAYIDVGNDGLLENHEVGLWNSNGDLLAQATVNNGSTIFASQSSLGRWYVTQINELFLSAGIYRVAGIVGNEDVQALSGDKVSISGVSLSSGYVRTSFPSGGFNFPGLSFSSQAIRASLTTGAFSNSIDVPTPSILALITLAGFGLFSRRFKK